MFFFLLEDFIQVILINFWQALYFHDFEAQDVPIQSSFDMNEVTLLWLDDVVVKIVQLLRHVLMACENEADTFDSLRRMRMKIPLLYLIAVYFPIFRLVKSYPFIKCPCWHQYFLSSWWILHAFFIRDLTVQNLQNVLFNFFCKSFEFSFE